ncbi:aminoacyl-tRNA hydrolase [bacterium]|nr:MAG: aminoacyl-tRNA hydrolase [bacterium]
MKLIVGLGNPGTAYRNTRHNSGFMAVDALVKGFAGSFRKDAKCGALKAKLNYKENDFILCKPLSYMNLSGGAVLKLMRREKITPRDILVVCDDVNLDLGRLRLRAGGSSGGHKGLESIIRSLSSDAFSRLRIGVSSPRGQKDISGYVLSPFSKDEQRVMREGIEKSKDALLCWLEYGIEETMNRFN